MTRLALTDQQLWTLQRWAAEEPAIVLVWVFGSRAEGRARDDSDLDLTVQLNLEPDEAEACLIEEDERWRNELTLLLGIKIIQIFLEDDERSCISGSGRKSGLLVYGPEVVMSTPCCGPA